MLVDPAIEIIPMTIDQAHLAAAAYEQYGRGRDGAALNFGDCFAYALAKSRGEPLLFKATDFELTDVMRT
jgi:ribonuclease VapC